MNFCLHFRLDDLTCRFIILWLTQISKVMLILSKELYVKWYWWELWSGEEQEIVGDIWQGESE